MAGAGVEAVFTLVVGVSFTREYLFMASTCSYTPFMCHFVYIIYNNSNDGLVGVAAGLCCWGARLWLRTHM
jgi:hypothetical protein